VRTAVTAGEFQWERCLACEEGTLPDFDAVKNHGAEMKHSCSTHCDKQRSDGNESHGKALEESHAKRAAPGQAVIRDLSAIDFRRNPTCQQEKGKDPAVAGNLESWAQASRLPNGKRIPAWDDRKKCARQAGIERKRGTR